MPDHVDNPSPARSHWSVSEMLLRCTFGTRTPAERRLILRGKIVGALILGWLLVGIITHMHPKPLMGVITLFLPAAFYTYYALEKRKYFLSPDELPRRIELEGMAWAYSVGVLATLWLGAIGYVVSLQWPLDPKLLAWVPFFLFGAFLASVKGAYRYFASRRY